MHNILHLNQKLFIFGKTETKYCSFCKIEEETAIHLFATCSETIRFWNSIKYFLRDNLVIPSLFPQSAIFGLFEIDPDVFKILNHILLLFKYFVYNSRESEVRLFSKFLKNLQKVYSIEKRISKQSKRKKIIFDKKWKKIQNKLKPYMDTC